MPLTARDPTKSTTDFTKNKESEYILKGSAKSNSNMASKKKLSLGSTDSLNFKKKKFSLQTNTKVGTSEKAGIVERPLTGSSLAAMAYGTSSGIFLKRSVLSNGTQEDLMNSNKKIQPITKKPTNGSLSSRTHKPTMDNGSLFMNAQAEYQRQTTNSNLTRKTDQGFSSPNLNNPLLTKTRLSKPELHGLTAKKSRISLQPDTGDPSRALHSSGALTDRSTNKDSKLSQIGQKSNVLVRVNTTNLVQASKFTKHITQAPQTKTEEKEKSELGKKISSKLIIINEDKDRALSSKVPIDLLSGRTRKSAITLTESKQISKGTSKAQESDRYAPPKKEIKSILEEINLIKGKMDHSTERPSSTNKPRKSPLNRKPQY
jgi:hypothetical protein